jgi:hypothetical protein
MNKGEKHSRLTLKVLEVRHTWSVVSQSRVPFGMIYDHWFMLSARLKSYIILLPCHHMGGIPQIICNALAIISMCDDILYFFIFLMIFLLLYFSCLSRVEKHMLKLLRTPQRICSTLVMHSQVLCELDGSLRR